MTYQKLVCVDSTGIGDAPQLIEGKAYEVEMFTKYGVELKGIYCLYAPGRFMTMSQYRHMEEEIRLAMIHYLKAK